MHWGNHMVGIWTFMYPLMVTLLLETLATVTLKGLKRSMKMFFFLNLSSDLPNTHGLAVDWVSRNLFWTSYDANKKQINVARLDGSFKNAVIQGLDKPHCLVLHPILGWAIHTQTHKHTHHKAVTVKRCKDSDVLLISTIMYTHTKIVADFWVLCYPRSDLCHLPSLLLFFLFKKFLLYFCIVFFHYFCFCSVSSLFI